MEYGAHLPQIDLTGSPWTAAGLASYARTATRLGFRALGANDHLVFQEPWLDGLVALASVIEASGDLTLATTVALPVIRGVPQLAKAAAALDFLSGGRLLLGVGPGSSRADYALAHVPFEERWPRFEAAVRELRSLLAGGDPALTPGPVRESGVPIWIGSWGSPAGLRRVARLGDGWLASAYNTTPSAIARDREEHHTPTALATMWTYVTDNNHERSTWLTRLAAVLGRPEQELEARTLIGSPEHCAALLREYEAAGVDLVFVWPLADHEHQLARLMRDVIPLVRAAAG